MDSIILNSVLSLGATGFVAATILYIAATKFKVEEDPRIDTIEDLLPSANCGGCGFAGCRQFAEICTKTSDISTLNCPVAEAGTMGKIGEILGQTVAERAPMIAVLRCNGSLENAPAKVEYDGIVSCKTAHSLHAGTSGCEYGCLGLSDCKDVCTFDAIIMNPTTGLPEVDEELCTACGACVKACPRAIFELRPKGIDSKRVYVSCMSTEKGAQAKKNCKVACIGCMKCTKIEGVDGVKVSKFLSYIDHNVDAKEHGQALVDCCPTNAIIGENL